MGAILGKLGRAPATQITLMGTGEVYSNLLRRLRLVFASIELLGLV